jgi:hypothetical protein
VADEADVRIGQIHTDLVITEGVGPLSPEDVMRLVKLVMEKIQDEQGRREDRDRDTSIRDRAYRPVLG